MPEKLHNNEPLAKLLQRVLALEFFFPTFTTADMAKYFLKSALYLYPAGESVIKQGDDGRDIYVIQQGSVSVSREGKDGQAAQLTVLHAGDIFGHVGFLRGSKRTAHVTAREVCRIYHLAYNDIKYMQIKNKELGCHLDKFAMDRI